LQICIDMDYIERRISSVVKEAAGYFPVICVTGPRQSGKSTMIKHLFPDYMQFTLEDLDVREFAKNDPIAFLSQTDKGMFLDEVQNVPELLSYIQGIVDRNPQRKFVISGSSNFSLMKEISQSLAGRVGIFELLPMSYGEIKDKVTDMSLDELLFRGQYPTICSGKNVPKYFYPSYLKTYLERDVRQIANIRDMMQFHSFIKLCAARIGSIWVASQLAAEVGVSVNTINAWLSVLQTAYVVQLLRPYSANTPKRYIKSPKLYFCDTGLACSILGIETPEQLARDKMRGNLFENFVINEALKSRYNQGKDNNLMFYRDSNQNEIDLLLTKNGCIDGVEIKSAMTWHKDFQRTLDRMETLIKEPKGKKYIVYAGEMENEMAEVKLLNYKHLDAILY